MIIMPIADGRPMAPENRGKVGASWLARSDFHWRELLLACARDGHRPEVALVSESQLTPANSPDKSRIWGS